jgi:hypothetical protein
MKIDACMFVFAYVEGEGWTRAARSCCGEFLPVGEHYYHRLSDLLHDLGDMQRCMGTL